MEKILVVFSIHDQLQALGRAMSSVLSQDVQDFELLVVDSGSSSLADEVLKNYTDKRISYKLVDGGNRQAARNAGIDHAKANGFKTIAFLDAEDYWTPDHLSTVQRLSKSFADANVFATSYSIKSGRRNKAPQFSNFKIPDDQVIDHFFRHNFKNVLLTASTFAVKTSVFEELDGFETEFTHGSEVDLWIRLGMHAKIAFSFHKTCVRDETVRYAGPSVPVAQRQFVDLDQYEQFTEEHDGLKKFLDLNRFSLSLAHRLENDIRTAVAYQQKIDSDSLTKQQRKLLEMSRLELKRFKRTNKVLGRLSWNLRSVR